MIKVSIDYDHQMVSHVKITGHAGFDEKGKDLVCAAVSSISIGTLNALDELANSDCKLTLADNMIKIEVLQINERSQLIIQTMIIQLKTLYEQYKDFIEIKQTEVLK